MIRRFFAGMGGYHPPYQCAQDPDSEPAPPIAGGAGCLDGAALSSANCHHRSRGRRQVRRGLRSPDRRIQGLERVPGHLQVPPARARLVPRTQDRPHKRDRRDSRGHRRNRDHTYRGHMLHSPVHSLQDHSVCRCPIRICPAEARNDSRVPSRIPARCRSRDPHHNRDLRRNQARACYSRRGPRAGLLHSSEPEIVPGRPAVRWGPEPRRFLPGPNSRNGDSRSLPVDLLSSLMAHTRDRRVRGLPCPCRRPRRSRSGGHQSGRGRSGSASQLFEFESLRMMAGGFLGLPLLQVEVSCSRDLARLRLRPTRHGAVSGLRRPRLNDGGLCSRW